MNPSAPGWIQKHFPRFLNFLETQPMDDIAFYEKLREAGFIYGHSAETVVTNMCVNPKMFPFFSWIA